LFPFSAPKVPHSGPMVILCRQRVDLQWNCGWRDFRAAGRNGSLPTPVGHASDVSTAANSGCT
jgi:hypothetical protein